MIVACADANDLDVSIKSHAELSEFDKKELIPRGRQERLLMQRAETLFTSPTVVSLEWSCKLATSEIVVGEPLVADITVKNPAEKLPFRFSAPYRGIIVGNVQVWIRAAGDEKYRLIDGLTRYPNKYPQAGVVVELGPGETRRWTSRLDHFAGRSHAGSRPIGRLSLSSFYWLGCETFDKPGKYEIILRYINQAIGPTKSERERYEPVGVRLFGPFMVTVKDRPATDPKWVPDLRAAWNMDRPPASDSIRTASEETVSPFTRLDAADLMKAGLIGYDVRLWLLGRNFGDERDAAALRLYLEDLQSSVIHLRGNHPNRQTAEFLAIAALLDYGDETEGLKRAFASSNPDIQALVDLWAKKKLSQRPK